MPVAVKLSPYFSSTGEMALRLDEAGADALVLFNRFLQPDIDPETLAVVPQVGLSSPAEARLPRTWIALLHGRVRASLAATTGVETPADVAKYLLAGADVVMTASALLRPRPEHATVLLDGLSDWMARKGSSYQAGSSGPPPRRSRANGSGRGATPFGPGELLAPACVFACRPLPRRRGRRARCRATASVREESPLSGGANLGRALAPARGQRVQHDHVQRHHSQ